MNVTRTNMTPGARALLAVACKPFAEEMARARQLSGKKKDLSDTCHKGRATDEAGAAHGVSGRSVSRAEAVVEVIAEGGRPQ